MRLLLGKKPPSGLDEEIMYIMVGIDADYCLPSRMSFSIFLQSLLLVISFWRFLLH